METHHFAGNITDIHSDSGSSIEDYALSSNLHSFVNNDDNIMNTLQQTELSNELNPSRFVGKTFPDETAMRIWVTKEFGGLINIHGKKFWTSGENISKYRSWTCSCKHEKKSKCTFKMYISWTKNSNGPIIKTSKALHTGHTTIDHQMILDNTYINGSEYQYNPNDLILDSTIDEVSAKIISSIQSRELNCKRKLAYDYCKLTFDKFLLRELNCTSPNTMRRKVNEFISINSTSNEGITIIQNQSSPSNHNHLHHQQHQMNNNSGLSLGVGVGVGINLGIGNQDLLHQPLDI